jgi:uncharacterized membrane protein
MTASADQSGARQRRGWHPPLTDFPIAAYLFTAAFDVISALGGRQHPWAGEFWHAGTFVLIAGGITCILAVLAGFRDLLVCPGPGALPVTVITVHVCVMVGVFMIGVADIAWRLRDYHLPATPPGILACSLVAAAGVAVGAAYGGTLVFRHGFAVAPAGPCPGDGAEPETAGPFPARASGQAARPRPRHDK